MTDETVYQPLHSGNFCYGSPQLYCNGYMNEQNLLYLGREGPSLAYLFWLDEGADSDKMFAFPVHYKRENREITMRMENGKMVAVGKVDYLRCITFTDEYRSDRFSFTRHGKPISRKSGALYSIDPQYGEFVYEAGSGDMLASFRVDDAMWDRRLVEWSSGIMQGKLEASREKGRGGWWDWDRCSQNHLTDLLYGHMGRFENGDENQLIDVAILALMVHFRNNVPCPGRFAGVDEDGD